MTAPHRTEGTTHGPLDRAPAEPRPTTTDRTGWPTAPAAVAPAAPEEVTDPVPDSPAGLLEDQ